MANFVIVVSYFLVLYILGLLTYVVGFAMYHGVFGSPGGKTI